MTAVKLPPRFYEDHVSRDLPAGTVVRSTKSYVVVDLTDAEHAELLSDARHYASQSAGFDEPEFRGLVASAKATVRRLTDLCNVAADATVCS